MSAHVVERLSAFLDEELPEAERREVQGHLEACSSCAAHLSELAMVDQAARGLAVQAPDGYFEALPGRIRQRLRAKHRPALPVWGWAAAAALLLAVVTPLLKRDPFSRQRAPAAASAPQASPPGTFALPQAPAPTAPAAEVPKPRPAQPTRKEAPSPSQGRLQPEADAVPRESRERKDAARDAATAEGPAPLAGFAPPPPPAPPPATPPPAFMEEEKLGAQEDVDRSSPSAASPGLAGGSLAKQRRKQEDEQGRAEAMKRSTTGARPGSRSPRSAEEARAIREDWRSRARRHPEGPEGDEARVGIVEAGAQAYRLSGDPQDLSTLRRDAEDYLARDDAREAERVREILRSVEDR